MTDTYAYNWQGMRTRAFLNGAYYRYLYNGEHVLQDLTDAGAVSATYTTEDDSYYGALLHLKRATGESRSPLCDETGSARGLVCASVSSLTAMAWRLSRDGQAFARDSAQSVV